MKCLFLSLIFLSLPSQAEILYGVAKNSKGVVVYNETHDIQKDQDGYNRLIRVKYTRADGTLFAIMISDFSKNRLVPDTFFEDYRSNSKVALRVVNTMVEFEEYKDGKSINKKTIPIEDSMVASQGFDNFIRRNFNKLGKESVTFKFGVLENKDFFTLTGYKKGESGENSVEFGIKATNWFIRLFANELRVIYDSKTLRLKSFIGRSNIFTDSGESQDVVITYRWGDST